MDESIAYGTPGIFIPINGHFEQEASVTLLGYKFDDIFRLETLIEDKIGQRKNPANLGGAQSAAKIISALC